MENEKPKQPERRDMDFKTFLESIAHIPPPSLKEETPVERPEIPPASAKQKETKIIHREPFMQPKAKDKSGFNPEPISLNLTSPSEGRREQKIRHYDLIPHKPKAEEAESATPAPEEKEPAAPEKPPERLSPEYAETPKEEEPVESAPPELPVILTPEQSNTLLRKLFDLMIQLKASDLHLAPGHVPCLRILGDIYQTEFNRLGEEAVTAILLPLLTSEQNALLQESGELDFAFEIPGLARFRANFYQQLGGIAASIRLIPLRIPSLEELKLPPLVKKIAHMRKGLIIVTGPTGCGKSTTLAAIINEINNSRNAHIITIEDPVEFVHDNKTCLISHREVGNSAFSYSEALRAAIREDPDIIMVGEMRDQETIALAIKAAEMGLLVLGTLHTNSAHKAIDRIIDVFAPEEQDQIRSMLADALSAVISQQLIKRADGQGRCAAVEILVTTPGLPNLIREGKTSQIASLIQTGREYGMQNMDHALIELIRQNAIFPAAARELVTDQKTFERFGIYLDQP